MASQAYSTPAPDDGRRLSVALEQEALERLDAHGMAVVVDALRAASRTVLGIFNQPRCDGEAAEILDDLMVSLDRTFERVLRFAEEREWPEASDYERIAWIRLKHFASGEDELPEFASLAAQLAAGLSARMMRGVL